MALQRKNRLRWGLVLLALTALIPAPSGGSPWNPPHPIPGDRAPLVPGAIGSSAPLTVGPVTRGVSESVLLPAPTGPLPPLSFATRIDIRTTHTVVMAGGDLDEDGWPDLVVVDQDSDTVSIFYGNGDGSFSDPQPLTVGQGAKSLAVVDLNRDSHLDIITANAQSQSLSVWLGQGDRTFQRLPDVAVEASPLTMAVADFNGDNIPDVVTTIPSSGSIRLQVGLGDGSFGPPREFSAGIDAPSLIQAADFNHDGLLDLVVGSAPDRSGQLSLLIGTTSGNGGFGRPILIPIAGRVQSLAAGDVNGDGLVDLLAGTLTVGDPGDEGHILVFLGSNDVTEPYFRRNPIISNTAPSPAAIALVPRAETENSVSDLVVALPRSQSVVFCTGDGQGRFVSGPLLPVGGAPHSLVTGRFHRDPFLDVAAANNTSSFDRGNISILLGTESGGFLLPPSPGVDPEPSPPAHPRSVVTADFDRDNSLDLAVANSARDTVSILTGDGRGNFQFQQSLSVRPPDDPRTYRPEVLVLGDFRNNGVPDLVALNRGVNILSYFEGKADGTFLPARPIPLHESEVAGRTRALTVGDFNRDNNLDLVVVFDPSDNQFPPELIVLLGQGDGTFVFAPFARNVGLRRDTSAILAANFSNDNTLDLAVLFDPIFEGQLALLPGRGDGSFDSPRFILDLSQFGPVDLVAADFNRDGRLDLAVINARSRSLSILLARDDGRFTESPPIRLPGDPAALVLADFAQDGRHELAVANQTSNNVSIFISNGDGSFTRSPVDWGAGREPVSIVLGDFNGDNKPDMAVANYEDDTVSILLQN